MAASGSSRNSAAVKASVDNLEMDAGIEGGGGVAVPHDVQPDMT
jgi:hypothetical protein